MLIIWTATNAFKPSMMVRWTAEKKTGKRRDYRLTYNYIYLPVHAPAIPKKGHNLCEIIVCALRISPFASNTGSESNITTTKNWIIYVKILEAFFSGAFDGVKARTFPQELYRCLCAGNPSSIVVVIGGFWTNDFLFLDKSYRFPRWMRMISDCVCVCVWAASGHCRHRWR